MCIYMHACIHNYMHGYLIEIEIVRIQILTGVMVTDIRYVLLY